MLKLLSNEFGGIAGKPFSGIHPIPERRVAAGGVSAAIRFALEQVPALVWTVDRSLRFTSVAGPCTRVFGFTGDDLYGKPIADCLVDIDDAIAALLLGAHERALDGGETRFDLPIGTSTFECIVRPGSDDQPTSQAVIGVAHDVTEKRRLADELRHTRRMATLGKLAGSVASDLVDLTSAIGARGAAVRDSIGDDDPRQRNLQALLDAADRAKKMATRLRACSRRRTAEPRPVDVNRVVTRSAPTLQRALGDTIELEVGLPDESWAVCATPGAVQRILLNLTTNARDAMPFGGKLTVTVHNECCIRGGARAGGGGTADRPELPPGDYVVLRVTDDGVGMSRDAQRRAFQAFFTTKTQGRGIGRGLTTCRDLVARMGGTIVVDSETGRGTTFTVYLPRDHAPSRPGAQPSSTTAPPEPNHPGVPWLRLLPTLGDPQPNAHESCG